LIWSGSISHAVIEAGCLPLKSRSERSAREVAMEELPVRARITDEITGVVYIVRCERDLSPEEIQLAIVEHKRRFPSTLRRSRGEAVEVRVGADARLLRVSRKPKR
jgi:hypothetical protein